MLFQLLSGRRCFPLPDSGVPLHVLNPEGRDEFQNFREGLPTPGEGHPPVNFHAYAAATGGVFAREVAELPEDGAPLLLLLRRRLRTASRALLALGDSRPVWVSWKETGTDQVKRQMGRIGNRRLLRQILARVEGALCPVDWIVGHYREHAGAELRCELVPTPYPLGEPGWEFRVPWSERRGILVGTREFQVPSRHHVEALVAAAILQAESGEPVTVVNSEGRAGRAALDAAWQGGEIEVIEGPLPYAEWLRLMARHKLVWQLDDSGVPGQVAGDSLLAGTPCLGGQGMNDRLLLEDWRARLTEVYREAQPFVLAQALLSQEGDAGQALLDRWREAGRQLDYAAGRRRLAEAGIVAPS